MLVASGVCCRAANWVACVAVAARVRIKLKVRTFTILRRGFPTVRAFAIVAHSTSGSIQIWLGAVSLVVGGRGLVSVKASVLVVGLYAGSESRWSELFNTL